MYAAAESSMPNVPHMNYMKALNADPTSYLNAAVAFGEKNAQPATIQLKGKMQQSQSRRYYLDNYPLTQVCKHQMQQGNSVLYACRNVTLQANLLDQYRFSVNFEKIPAFWKNVTYKAYAAMRFAAYQYVSEDFISPNNPPNQIEFNANFAPDLRSVNLTMAAPLFTAQFKNLRLNRNIRPWVVMHPDYTPLQLADKHFFKGQAFPSCVVDNSLAQTFDNKTYPINLGKCWYTMFHYTPKEDPTSSESSSEDDQDNFSVLVRDASSPVEKEVIIVLGEYNINMQPTSGDSPAKVVVNGQQTPVSKNHMTELYDENGNTLAQMYALPDGEVRFYAPQQDTEIQFDGTAVKINVRSYLILIPFYHFSK
uniref:VWFD domain-containing protein n=1 Tax=Homalodisca liturata TaxID=320908 RepID=A0A1B6JLU1_9HEMI